MTFDERKERVLEAMRENDRSKKGSVDKSVMPLLDAINALPDYYTTSSCGGRILLLDEPASGKKNAYGWPLVTHEEADAKEFVKALHELTGDTVWLRMQTVIVHVACKDLEAAEQLLEAFYSHGWKRSGIFSLRNDVMVELLSVEGMDAPVVVEGERVVDDDYVRAFVRIANGKLATAHEKIASAVERVEKLAKNSARKESL